LLAISDYVAGQKVPLLGLAAAEDMTQRKPNPYFVRASGTSAQAMHPLADYASKELNYETVITVSDDFAFGYEQMGGFQRVFEDAGANLRIQSLEEIRIGCRSANPSLYRSPVTAKPDGLRQS
jgi:branched-chain amino acid transport system substrate-binding protein